MLPGKRIQINGFYGIDDWAADAVVKVYRADGQLLREAGVMDEKGVFVFPYARAEDLKVVVLHDGHTKEITIPARELNDAGSAATPAAAVDEPRLPLLEIVVGISLLLALASFYLSARTLRRLRALEERAGITATAEAADKPHPTALPTGQAPG